jgi:hypothetical protein
MSQRHSTYARRADDDYPTPTWVTQIIVPYLRRHASFVWDPAMGSGQMTLALARAGFRVLGTTDDFLTQTKVPELGIDAVCTNPPYGPCRDGKLACQFIEHALELVPVVAMLLRIDFDSAKTRTHLFRDCPAFAQKIVLLDRIVWFAREGAPGPSDNHCWAIWNKRHIGPAIVAYAEKVGS